MTKHSIRTIVQVLAASILALLLSGCASPGDPNLVECDLWQKICYRGHVVDRMATRQRFGIEGIRAIEHRRANR